MMIAALWWRCTTAFSRYFIIAAILVGVSVPTKRRSCKSFNIEMCLQMIVHWNRPKSLGITTTEMLISTQSITSSKTHNFVRLDIHPEAIMVFVRNHFSRCELPMTKLFWLPSQTCNRSSISRLWCSMRSNRQSADSIMIKILGSARYTFSASMVLLVRHVVWTPEVSAREIRPRQPKLIAGSDVDYNLGGHEGRLENWSIEI